MKAGIDPGAAITWTCERHAVCCVLSKYTSVSSKSSQQHLEQKNLF
jgi:hypothetical protein